MEPPKPPKPEPPKPTAEELKKQREERLKKMRESMVKDKPRPVPPRSNGRTEQRPPNWQQLLNQNYKPSNRNAGLDASDDQRCHRLIHDAFHDRWTPPPWTSELKVMALQVQFDMAGNVTGYRLTSSSGDPSADATVLGAAKGVPSVRGLSRAFLERNRTVTIRFDVKPM